MRKGRKMGFMDGVSAFTKGVGQKAKGNYDIVTMNNRIMSLQKEIRGIYLQIGEKYYAVHKENPEAYLEGFVKAVQNLEIQIASVSQQVESTKAATAAVQLISGSGGKLRGTDGSNGFCASCGAPLPADSLFCVKCGAKIMVDESILGEGTMEDGN